MFRGSLNLGKPFGIRLRAHWSLLIIFLLIAAHLGFGVLPNWHPDWSGPMIAAVAVGAALIFFASIALHELAHALTARLYGLEVGDITLFLFGGVSNIESEPRTPLSEAVIAIVGPIASIVIGASMLGIAAFTVRDLGLIETDPEAYLASIGPFTTVLLWVGPINLLLAIFNMIPAFPLDGGRVLRAILWGATNDLTRATRWATGVSIGLSWVLIGTGLLMALGFAVPFLGAGLVGGLWLAVIGWFIGQSARASLVAQELSSSLEGVQAGDLASRDVPTVTPDTPIELVVKRYVSGGVDDPLLVRDGQTVVGVVHIDDVQAIPRSDWSQLTAGDVMREFQPDDTIRPEDPAYEAFRKISRHNARELPVVGEDGRFAGVIRLADLMRWVRMYGPRRPPRAA